MAKSDSLLSILWLLRSRGRMTAHDLAGELGVDVRTVYRYIDSLSVSGAPIVAESGPNGGYSLLETFSEMPLFFTRDERVALAHASLFARRAGYPYSDALTGALQKIEQRMSPEQVRNLQFHVAGLEVIDTTAEGIYSLGEDTGSAPDTHSRKDVELQLKTIEAAVAERRQIEILHIREIEEPPLRRQVDPYGLVFWRETWYLVGYCHLRQDIRMFRCDKIVSASETDGEFEKPDDFSAREYFLHSLIPNEVFAETVTVRMSGTPNAIANFSRHWYYRNFIRERSMGRLGLAIDVEDAVEFLPDVLLSYGTSIIVLEPEELRRAVVEQAENVVRKYRDAAP